jgi:hypothetical protein
MIKHVPTWGMDGYTAERVTLLLSCTEKNYLDLRGRKWQEAGEDCILRSFITYTVRQIL